MSTPSRHMITVVCPFCKTRVRIEELPAHKKEFHAQEMKLPDSTQRSKLVDNSSIDSKTSAVEFTSCPVCTVRVKADRLPSHLAKVHPNSRYPYQPPRVHEAKKPVVDDNSESVRSERSPGSDHAPRSVIHRSSPRPEPSQPDDAGTPIYGVVKCPFCGKQVPTKKLAEHARTSHARQNNQSSKSDPTIGAPRAMVKPIKPFVSGLRDYFIDPSGFLVNPDLVREEIKINGDDQPRGVTRGHSTSRRRFARAKKSKPSVTPTTPAAGEDNQPSRSIDDTFRDKVEWLNRLSNVIETANHLGHRGFRRCPVCKVEVKLKNLRKHLSQVHPDIQLPDEQSEKLQNGVASQNGSQKSQNVRQTRFGRKQTQVSARDFRRSLNKKRRSGPNSISNPVDDIDLYEQANAVKCPLCNHRTQYSVLFVHLQVSHPEVNPKIVMARFNRVNRSRDYENLSRYQDELNELVKEYERLKQGQDEPRDGSKYIGHTRREWNGQFGSFPLHDDYSDEADAD